VTTRDFRRAMRDADAALEQLSMPADASLRLRRGVILAQRQRRRAALLVLGFTAACAAALLVARDRTALQEVANLPDGFESLAHSSDLQLKTEAAPWGRVTPYLLGGPSVFITTLVPLSLGCSAAGPFKILKLLFTL